MKLNEENRASIVSYRLQKAKETLAEAKANMSLGFWRVVANRLYYACYYAVSALLVKQGLTTHTHSGTLGQFSLHFVKSGIVSKEQSALYGKLFDIRQTGDYSDMVAIKEADVKPFIEPAEKFVAEVEKLLNR